MLKYVLRGETKRTSNVRSHLFALQWQKSRREWRGAGGWEALREASLTPGMLSLADTLGSADPHVRTTALGQSGPFLRLY